MPSQPGAGLLLYRRRDGGAQVLLFHRGGPGFANRDKGVWMVPISPLPSSEPPAPVPGGGFRPRTHAKPRLTAARLQTALREHAREELARLLGVPVPEECVPLGGVKMRGHRIVYVWAGEDRSGTEPILAAAASASGAAVYDRVAYLDLSTARTFIDTQQRRFLDQLEGVLGV